MRRAFILEFPLTRHDSGALVVGIAVSVLTNASVYSTQQGAGKVRALLLIRPEASFCWRRIAMIGCKSAASRRTGRAFP